MKKNDPNKNLSGAQRGAEPKRRSTYQTDGLEDFSSEVQNKGEPNDEPCPLDQYLDGLQLEAHLEHLRKAARMEEIKANQRWDDPETFWDNYDWDKHYEDLD